MSSCIADPGSVVSNGRFETVDQNRIPSLSRFWSLMLLIRSLLQAYSQLQIRLRLKAKTVETVVGEGSKHPREYYYQVHMLR